MAYKAITSGALASALTVAQAAERLGVSYQTIYKMVRRGQLPSSKVGGRYFIAPEAIEALLPPKPKEESKST